MNENTTLGDCSSSIASSSVVNKKSNSTDNAKSLSSNDDFLEYPRNLFHDVTGASPANAASAELWWSFRKNRPKKGVVETQTPSGALMLEEIELIRSSLKKSIENEFIEGVRERAMEHNFILPETNCPVVSKKDIIRVLKSLVHCTQENQELVYKVVHEFHKERHWQANAIDKWFHVNKMILLPETETDRKRSRKHSTDRGGFGVVARQAKSQAVQSLMLPMLKKTGWCISLINNQKKSSRNSYTAVKTIENEKEVLRYYVVRCAAPEQSQVKRNAAGESETIVSSDDHVEYNSFFDYEKMASLMEEQWGISVTHDQIDYVMHQSVTLTKKDNLTGKMMMLRMPSGEENAMTTITTENQLTPKSKLHSSRENTAVSLLDGVTNIYDPTDPNDDTANILLFGTTGSDNGFEQSSRASFLIESEDVYHPSNEMGSGKVVDTTSLSSMEPDDEGINTCAEINYESTSNIYSSISNSNTDLVMKKNSQLVTDNEEYINIADDAPTQVAAINQQRKTSLKIRIPVPVQNSKNDDNVSAHESDSTTCTQAQVQLSTPNRKQSESILGNDKLKIPARLTGASEQSGTSIKENRCTENNESNDGTSTKSNTDLFQLSKGSNSSSRLGVSVDVNRTYQQLVSVESEKRIANTVQRHCANDNEVVDVSNTTEENVMEDRANVEPSIASNTTVGFVYQPHQSQRQVSKNDWSVLLLKDPQDDDDDEPDAKIRVHDDDDVEEWDPQTHTKSNVSSSSEKKKKRSSSMEASGPIRSRRTPRCVKKHKK